MITLIPLKDTFSIYQLPEKQEIPAEIISSSFCSITKTEDEVSVITNCTIDFEFRKSPGKWKGFRVEGSLDFSLIGIINDITSPLKEAGISVFVISTFNTDYLFVAEDSFEKTISVLKLADYIRKTD